MAKMYDVYVDGGQVIKEGITFKFKKEFCKFFSKPEAERYKVELEKKYKDVILEEKESSVRLERFV